MKLQKHAFALLKMLYSFPCLAKPVAAPVECCPNTKLSAFILCPMDDVCQEILFVGLLPYPGAAGDEEGEEEQVAPLPRSKSSRRSAATDSLPQSMAEEGGDFKERRKSMSLSSLGKGIMRRYSFVSCICRTEPAQYELPGYERGTRLRFQHAALQWQYHCGLPNFVFFLHSRSGCASRVWHLAAQ